MLTKELEGAGIPTAHVTAMTPVAVMGGSPRIVQGKAIINPWGKSDADPDEERAMRREIAAGALKVLQEDGRDESPKPVQD